MVDVSCEYANSLLAQLEKAERELESMTAGRDAALELAAELARERDEDGPPECDNCAAVMDGHMAATSDVCLDCWNRSHDAESEVARLTEALTEVQRAHTNANSDLQLADARCARLTEALAAAERDASRNKSWEPLHDAEQERAEAAERDRDAANALLRRCRDGFDWNQYDDTEQNQIGRDLEAHLSSQHAASARTLCPRCGWISTRESTGDDDTWARCKCWEPEGPSHLRQPAAPTHTHLTDAARKLDAERQAVKQTWFSIGSARISLGSIKAALGLAGLHIVTAADKAVLDAMSRAHIDDKPKDYDGPVMLLSEEHAVCRAELARRGAK